MTLATVVKIIDLTDESVCTTCLLGKLDSSFKNEQLAGREAPAAIKLTSAQVKAFEGIFELTGDGPCAIWGVPVWEVA